MEFTLWLTFVAATAAMMLIPGPTVMLLLSKGRSVAVASAAGVAMGDFIKMSASVAGLGALVLTSAALFTALKWVGAVYLVWLGIKLAKPNVITWITRAGGVALISMSVLTATLKRTTP